jgi:N-acetylmuramoyl-L-alanine amidase
MVYGTPWRVRRGILVALTLLCAHTPLRAQSLLEGAENLLKGADSLFGGSSERTRLAAAATPQQRTRFVIGLPKTTEFEVFSLSNPNRVVVQVDETKLRLPEQPKSAPVGLIKSFQAGLAGTDRSRIIIYVTEPVIVSSARIEKANDGRNQHLVVEIAAFVPVTASISPSVKQVAAAPAISPPPFALGGAGLQPPLPRPAVSPDVLAQRAFKPIIVIDPGHGGHDSGAMKNGAVEKDITLAFSKLLAKKLNATGRFKVLMTREEDVFIPLGDRVDFGEKHKANLFIAVHCDYADTGSTASGATIYSLRDSVADSLRRSTRDDVAGSVLSKNEVEEVKKAGAGDDISLVKNILADLAEREVDATHDRTGVFAKTVIQTMGASTAMRTKPDQQASFRVLKTAQFPSVLIELAYVTNKQDAANLQSDAWRDKVTDSILSAIDNYFSNQMAQLPM